ncbi:flagellin [Clostridium estertheticum]|uniref:flagellin n=1 Tax=Clostridium estertheticum TaxID=238834 RepID=UPI0009FD76F8|nr:flagellin [Clostridium estertheticum]MBU3074169.1 flagellin [Clostridium estertheticum]MBU3164263.1 flagellin [Clostridium estertheticum]
MIINNNFSLLNSYNKLTKNKPQSENVIEKISSGKRINRSSDDSAGLAISESFKAQVRGLSAAQNCMGDGISLLQVTDGALGEISTLLHRMKETSVQASTGTLSNEDRKALDNEFKQMKAGIDEISQSTNFNDIKLLTDDKYLDIQTRDTPYASYSIKLFDTSTTALGLDTASLNSQTDSSNAISKIDEALIRVINNRTSTGADLNSIQHSLTDATNANYNINVSLSQIEDINMATATMKMVRFNALESASNQMLLSSRLNNENVNNILNKWLQS